MGIPRAEESLGGITRVTTSTPEHRSHLAACVSLAEAPDDDEYNRNIQIADLNALNAALARHQVEEALRLLPGHPP